ncbi:MAG: HAMP domain-containing protein, partial [Anaerolineae bacterium]
MINRILRRLAVNRRITGGFLILALLLALSVPLIITNQNFILQRLQQVSNVETRADRLLLVASTRIASSRVNLIRYIQGYAASPRVALDDVDQAAQLLGQARDLITSEEQQKSVTLILDAMELYRKLIGELQEARDSGMTVTAGRLEFQTFRLGSDIGQRIELIVSNSEAGVAEANRSIFVQARGRLVFLVAGYIGVLALTVLFAVLVARSITLPVAELRRAADEFRQGNMQVAVPVTGTDELSLLAQTFNQLSAELSTLYRNLEQRVEDRTQRLETVAAL